MPRYVASLNPGTPWNVEAAKPSIPGTKPMYGMKNVAYSPRLNGETTEPNAAPEMRKT